MAIDSTKAHRVDLFFADAEPVLQWLADEMPRENIVRTQVFPKPLGRQLVAVFNCRECANRFLAAWRKKSSDDWSMVVSQSGDKLK